MALEVATLGVAALGVPNCGAPAFGGSKCCCCRALSTFGVLGLFDNDGRSGYTGMLSTKGIIIAILTRQAIFYCKWNIYDGPFHLSRLEHGLPPEFPPSLAEMTVRPLPGPS